MGLQAWDLQDLGDAPSSMACLLLPFLPLQLQEETALKTSAFPRLFVLLKPPVAGHHDGKWSSVWFRQWCWRRLSSCFLLKGSRLNPLISFPVDYQELVCVLPSPVSWASSAFSKIQQAFESCEALMTKHRSCIWVLMGKIQASGYFLYVGYFWGSEHWRVFIYAFRSYFQKEQCRSLCAYVSIPLVCFYSYFINKRNIF